MFQFGFLALVPGEIVVHLEDLNLVTVHYPNKSNLVVVVG